MSRSAKESSFPVKVVVFLLAVVFVGAVVQNVAADLGVIGVILMLASGVLMMRGFRSVRRRFR